MAVAAERRGRACGSLARVPSDDEANADGSGPRPERSRARKVKPKTEADAAEILNIDGRDVRVTHPTKLYFSRQARLTKLDLVRYYLAVAPGALQGIRDRPIVLKRFVNGAEAEPFYQKRAPDPRPDWLRTVTLSFPSGRVAEEVVVDDAAGLAWVVNLGCIELHPHPVRSADLEHPDELRVDLDPGPGVEWADVSLNKGLATIKLKPGNNVRPNQFWEAIRKNGNTPKITRVTVRGAVLSGGAQVRVVDSGETFELKPSLETAQQIKAAAGKTVTLEGTLTPGKDLKTAVPLEVTAVRP